MLLAEGDEPGRFLSYIKEVAEAWIRPMGMAPKHIN